MVTPVNHVYVNMINAFRTDCSNLIKKFEEKNSEDFRDFSAIWKAFKFNLVYEKYTHHGLHYDFKQDTLQIAKTIMLHDNFVGGLYLLYALYYVQEDPKPSIRLEYGEFEKLQSLLKEERMTLLQTCQPGYLFSKLLKNDAFTFVRFARDFTMEGQNRARLVFNNQPYLRQESKTINKREWLEDCLRKINIIDDIKKLDEKYSQATNTIKEEHPELNLALSMMPEDLPNDILKYIMNEESEEKPPITKLTDIGVRRRRLKNRTLNIKHRYRKANISKAIHQLEQDVKPSIKVKSAKKKGAPKGKRKLYFRTMVNEPESESEKSYESDEDDPKLSLPFI